MPRLAIAVLVPALALACSSAPEAGEGAATTGAASDDTTASVSDDTGSSAGDDVGASAGDDTGAGDGDGAASDLGTVEVGSVDITGSPGAYTFTVELASNDTGCARYADWWEVTSADGGELLYRRVLLHSHVTEQPFARSGGPVAIDADTEVVVRAHTNTGGYAESAWRGSASGGDATSLADDFGVALETVEPLPASCAF